MLVLVTIRLKMPTRYSIPQKSFSQMLSPRTKGLVMKSLRPLITCLSAGKAFYPRIQLKFHTALSSLPRSTGLGQTLYELLSARIGQKALMNKRSQLK